MQRWHRQKAASRPAIALLCLLLATHLASAISNTADGLQGLQSAAADGPPNSDASAASGTRYNSGARGSGSLGGSNSQQASLDGLAAVGSRILAPVLDGLDSIGDAVDAAAAATQRSVQAVAGGTGVGSSFGGGSPRQAAEARHLQQRQQRQQQQQQQQQEPLVRNHQIGDDIGSNAGRSAQVITVGKLACTLHNKQLRRQLLVDRLLFGGWRTRAPAAAGEHAHLAKNDKQHAQLSQARGRASAKTDLI